MKSSQPRGSQVAMFLLAALFLYGCGKSPDASETDAPLDGRLLGRANQLVGTWMYSSAGEFAGLEFLKDGKVIATLPRGVATFQYSVLDGGRLSLERPGGQTTVYSVTLAGEQMEITPEVAGGRTSQQRFERIKSSQTLPQAMQARAATLAEARERRMEALQKLLANEDLVVVKAEAKGPAALLAIRFEPSFPQLNGYVVMIENPNNINPLSPVRVHSFSGNIGSLDEFTDRLQVTLDVQPARIPTGQEKYRGRIILIATGSGSQTELRGDSNFPESWQGSANMVLKRDRKLHQSAAALLEAQTEAYRQALAKVSEPLGGRALLSGRKTFSGGNAEVDISLYIEQSNTPDRFAGRSKLGSAPEQTINAETSLLLGQGALYINLPNGEQWRLQLDESSQSYRGFWRPNLRADFISHGTIELQLDRVWTIGQVQAEREAIQRFIQQDLRNPIAFTGFVDMGKPGDPERWPVRVELQTHADGKASGKAWYLGQGVGVELSGTVSGINFNLQTTGAMEGSASFRNLAQQRWVLSLDQMDPEPKLSGRMNATMGGSGSVELHPINASRSAAIESALLKALSEGTFKAVNTTISRRPDPTYFRLQVDQANGSINGDVVGNDLTGRTGNALPPGLVSGSMAKENGHVLLKMVVEGSPEPVRKREGERFEYTLAASLHEEEGLILFGWGPFGPGNQTWLTLTPVQRSVAAVVHPEQQLRLAAQRMGARAEEPRDPKPGDSVVLIVNVTERDARVGQLFFADGKYTHRNSIATAAIHAGLAKPGEVCVLQVDYGDPFTAPVEIVERNGVASQRGTFRANNTLPTYTLKRLQVD